MLCTVAQCSGVSWIWLVSPASLPEVPPDVVVPGVAFPAVGPWDIGSPPSRLGARGPSLRYYEPRRLPVAHLGGVRCSLSFPEPLGRASGFVSLARARLVGEADAATPRRESSPRWSALLGLMCPQGDHWLSQVPASPL